MAADTGEVFMKRAKAFQYKRLIWYLTGFVLFYAPFSLFERLLAFLIHADGRQDIHGSCLRCGLLGITGSIKMDILSVRGISALLLLLSAFFVGPVFCRYFCTAGAITEYLSRIVPDRLKVNWQKYLKPAPVRYGVLAGFLAIPLTGLSVACAYCNYSLFERITLGIANLDIGVLSSTNILTLFVWLILLGVFSKGGRGFCSYLCPVGAAQSLVHYIGSRFGFTYRLKVDSGKCISCGACTLKCPMGAMQPTKAGIKNDIHNCITCGQCVNACPNNALKYKPIDNRSKKPNEIYLKEDKGKENEMH